MPLENLSKISHFIQQTQSVWAVMLGMFVQFWFGEKKGGRVAMTIFLSSVFIALYFIPSAIEVLNIATVKMFNYKIEPKSDIAIMLYASSSLISLELMAFLIQFLPRAFSQKITKYLGVEDETDSKQS